MQSESQVNFTGVFFELAVPRVGTERRRKNRSRSFSILSTQEPCTTEGLSCPTEEQSWPEVAVQT